MVAKDLLGKYVVRRVVENRPTSSKNKKAGFHYPVEKIIRAKITETEAYHGPKDLASHASRGKTSRTEVMFGRAGRSYVYLIYGMYHCFNIVTDKENFPSAVLIRGVEIKNLKIKNKNDNLKLKINGPGKLCRELKINKELNNIDLTKSRELWVEDPAPQEGRGKSGYLIRRMPRIGVDYAKEYKDKKWRFVLTSK